MIGEDVFRGIYSSIGAVMMIIGILDCFFGYKIQKILAVIQTFLTMLLISFLVTSYVAIFGVYDSPGVVLLAMLLLTVIICYLTYRFFLIGVFFTTFIIIIILGWIIGGDDVNTLILSASLAFFTGYVAVKFHEITLILLTSLRGGIYCGIATIMLLNEPLSLEMVILCSFLFFVVGFIVQIKMNKKHLQKTDVTNEIKKETEQKQQSETTNQKIDTQIAEEKNSEEKISLEKISQEQKTEQKNNDYHIKMPNEKQIKENAEIAYNKLLKSFLAFFSEEREKSIIEKISRFAHLFIIAAVAVSIFLYFQTRNAYFVKDWGDCFHLHAYAVALAIFAAENKKYNIITISFAIWTLGSIRRWFLEMNDYGGYTTFYFCTIILYGLITLFAASAWYRMQKKKKEDTAL